MCKASIEDILAPKPEARPRIHAYSIADAALPYLKAQYNKVPGIWPRSRASSSE